MLLWEQLVEEPELQWLNYEVSEAFETQITCTYVAVSRKNWKIQSRFYHWNWSFWNNNLK